MSTTVYLVEGWTEPIRTKLYADNVIQDLTGMSVELEPYLHGVLQTFTGVAEIESPESSGIVRYTPSSADLVKGRYKIRWKITDLDGKVAFFPNSVTPELWIVSKP